MEGGKRDGGMEEGWMEGRGREGGKREGGRERRGTDRGKREGWREEGAREGEGVVRTDEWRGSGGGCSRCVLIVVLSSHCLILIVTSDCCVEQTMTKDDVGHCLVPGVSELGWDMIGTAVLTICHLGAMLL